MSEETGRSPAPGGSPPDVRAQVDAMLARFRAELLGGRGPGASEAELDRNTTHRPTVGGTPTAVTRELLHLRTQRRRGTDPGRLHREETWAHAWAAGARTTAHDRPSTGRRLLRAAALLAVAAAVANRLRRWPRAGSGQSSSHTAMGPRR